MVMRESPPVRGARVSARARHGEADALEEDAQTEDRDLELRAALERPHHLRGYYICNRRDQNLRVESVKRISTAARLRRLVERR